MEKLGADSLSIEETEEDRELERHHRGEQEDITYDEEVFTSILVGGTLFILFVVCLGCGSQESDLMFYSEHQNANDSFTLYVNGSSPETPSTVVDDNYIEL